MPHTDTLKHTFARIEIVLGLLAHVHHFDLLRFILSLLSLYLSKRDCYFTGINLFMRNFFGEFCEKVALRNAECFRLIEPAFPSLRVVVWIA